MDIIKTSQTSLSSENKSDPVAYVLQNIDRIATRLSMVPDSKLNDGDREEMERLRRVLFGCAVTMNGIKEQRKAGVVPDSILKDFVFTAERAIDSISKMVDDSLRQAGVSTTSS
jgi:hypothetical protein